MRQTPPLPPHVASLEAYASARSLLKGGGWVFLDANESPSALAGVPARLPDWNRYPDPTADALRADLAAHYRLRPENVIVANGSDELIDLATRTFVRRGRGVLSVRPTYGMYKVCADAGGVPFRTVPLGKDFAFPEDRLRRAFGRADLLFLCSPNNPTGQAVDPAALARVAERFPGLVVVDEAYGEFADAQGLTSAADLVRRGAENVLVLRTFSKAFAAAGVRLGYGIASRRVTDVLQKTKLPYNVSSLAQAVGRHLWARRARMERNVRRLLAERIRLQRRCAAAGCRVLPSVTNFFLFRLPAGIDGETAYERLRDGHGIVTRRLRGPRFGRVLRVSVGTRRENDLFLSSLAAVLP